VSSEGTFAKVSSVAQISRPIKFPRSEVPRAPKSLQLSQALFLQEEEEERHHEKKVSMSCLVHGSASDMPCVWERWRSFKLVKPLVRE